MPRKPVSAGQGSCLRSQVVGVLGAVWLLLAAAWPTAAEDKKSPTAILIIARGELRDPNFADSVVLVLNNLGPAPVGLVVNRPTEIPVARLFPDLKHLTPLHDKVYFGGPVDLESVWFLFRAPKAPEHAIQAFAGIYLSSSRNLLQQLLGREKPMEGLRIFIGHSGWAPGQLEAEIARGAWTLERAEPDAVFKGRPEHPWPTPSNDPNRST
ncbi:MAG TPA: YqgE/AlgH family protein [Steroidobacteraceae bacterium]